MEIAAFEPELHAPAAELVARRVAVARRQNPLIPVAWADPESYLPELAALHRRGSGVAMLRDGRMVGFMAAYEVRRGTGWIYAPEWGLAAEPFSARGLSRQRIIEELYAAAATRWVEDGFRAHYLAVLADDRTARRAVESIGFGWHTMDGLRDLARVTPRTDVAIRRATRGDAATLGELEAGLRDHLAGSPAFVQLGPARTLADHRKRIADQRGAVLLAEVDGRVVGHLLVGPSSDDAATIIRDSGTASISGAFVRPEHRRAGVGETLLAAAVEWARQGAYERMAVDFETANVLARRFWTRFFRPVTISLARRL